MPRLSTLALYTMAEVCLGCNSDISTRSIDRRSLQNSGEIISTWKCAIQQVNTCDIDISGLLGEIKMERCAESVIQHMSDTMLYIIQ